jgi:uncharacterized protein (DUF1501 family)
MKRRSFLAGTGLGLAALFARKGLVAFAGSGTNKTVVVVQMRGAVDGLAMIPPHGDPLLAGLRPSLAPKNALDLDGYWGLHPSLAPLLPLYQAKQLAIVPAVGLPGASRSHFEAQDLLEQGGTVTSTGWANRLRAGSPNDTGAVAIGNALPRVLAGPSPSLVIEPNGQLGLARGAPAARRTQLADAFTALCANRTDAFSATATRALASAARVEKALAALPPKTAQPKGPMAAALSTAARLIRADLGAELVVVDTTGWDTHTQQGPRLDRNFTLLADGLALFAAELGDRLADVTLVTVSEFGRTVRENGTGGTDHGTATMSLVLGGAVAGGRIVGTWPGLREDQRFEGRDLAIGTDVRDLLADTLAPLPVQAAFPDHAVRPLGIVAR